MCYSLFDAGLGLVSPAISAPRHLLGLTPKSAKSFPCRTYEKCAHNSFVCHTYEKTHPPIPESVNQELA